MKDENYLTGRLKRYSQVGISGSKIAAKVMGRKLSGADIFNAQASSEIAKIMGNLKGPIMKVAQIMATIPDALPPELSKELEIRLREELDYQRERKNMALFRDILKDVTGVNVPKANEDLCSERLLTMQYLSGRPLLEVYDKPGMETNEIAKNLFVAWYKPLYHYGVVHGDPHPGNYSVSEDGSLNLLDFGAVRFFKGDFIAGILQLYEAMRDNDKEKATHAYESWGFEGLNTEIIEVLNRWARYVYTPLLDDNIRRIHDTDDGMYGAEVAADIHIELRRLGGIKPPSRICTH